MARTVKAEALAILRFLQDGYTYWLHGSTDLERRAVERLEAQGKIVKRYAWSRSRGRWEPVYYLKGDWRADGMHDKLPADPYCYFYTPAKASGG